MATAQTTDHPRPALVIDNGTCNQSAAFLSFPTNPPDPTLIYIIIYVIPCFIATIRSGVSGASQPRTFIPAMVSRRGRRPSYQQPGTLMGVEGDDVHVGQDAWFHRHTVPYSYPIQHGIINDWYVHGTSFISINTY
jgi:hypothetical protein